LKREKGMPFKKVCLTLDAGDYYRLREIHHMRRGTSEIVRTLIRKHIEAVEKLIDSRLEEKMRRGRIVGDEILFDQPKPKPEIDLEEFGL
jgi:hypothetical protein